MKTRNNVKINVNMFDDTKLKIIDTKPERDLIHYIWFRMVTLAGKVNRDGELYLSNNIPFTPETFAIEFNRGTYQINLALDILIELEMIDIIDNNVYRVKNFSKHQCSRKREQSIKKVKEENIEKTNEQLNMKKEKNIESAESIKDNISNSHVNFHKKDSVATDSNSLTEKGQFVIDLRLDKDSKNRESDITAESTKNKDSKAKESDITSDSAANKDTVSVKKHPKKTKKNSAKRKCIDINESEGEEELINFYDGEISIKDGTVISTWNFENM